MAEGLVKIAIVGPESTGKSALANDLAAHFHTTWVEEYAREYLEALGRPYESWDLNLIAQGQLQAEKKAESSANRILFCDTNLLVIKIWSEFRYGFCDREILRAMNLHGYDHYLLTDIDLPWTPDPLREHPHAREELLEIYRQSLLSEKLPFSLIQGLGKDRLENALSFLEPVLASYLG